MGESQRLGERSYTLIFSDLAMEDLAFHRKQATGKRIVRILQELETIPFAGIGNPHELLYGFAGQWSRHFNKKDVILYKVDETEKRVYIISARYHYSDK